MNWMCGRPAAFFGLLLLIPAGACLALRIRRVARCIPRTSAGRALVPEMARLWKLPRILLLRGAFWSAAWTMLVLAYAGISWGVRLAPVQKSGTAVSFVFDISYSMNAADAAGGMTRLRAAEQYASLLLSQLPDSSVSVTLAKGEGIVVVPLTEDKAVVGGLLETLSPGMMSSSGSSLGKGILTALKSFPERSPLANVIWVFTDGDETDAELSPALAECVRRGVSVCLIGFGSQQGAQVLAGDGRTAVHTALRAEQMRGAAEAAMNGAAARRGRSAVVQYVDSMDAGSALSVLDASFPKDASPEAGNNSAAYESVPVPRHPLFLWLSLLFFACGVLVSEADAGAVRKRLRGGASVLAVFVLASALSSCGARFDGAKAILFSSWSYHRRQYDAAVAGFLQAACDAAEDGDGELLSYALYGLASTYLAEDECRAAELRFNQIPADAPQAVRYAAFYNLGICADRAGDSGRAVECFKKALEADGTQIDAKINLELSQLKVSEDRRSKESSAAQLPAAGGASALEQAIFELIKENDQKQWKSSEQQEQSGSASDY
ncbi:MAG: VWA domain-containing protein [Treponemataceae bacterium]|nr:VWA domain-containing protein [Treponemataceae bacterium]